MALPIFGSLYEAKKEGYEPYDRAKVVFIVRKREEGQWKLAIVQLTLEPRNGTGNA